MRVTDLTPAARAQLETFNCGAPNGVYWGQVVNSGIGALPWFLDHRETEPGLHVIGFYDDDELCAVATFGPVREKPELWYCDLVAVRVDRQGAGLGRRLIESIIERARGAGARAVVSQVHADNAPMLKINRALGAEIDSDPLWPHERICTISLSD